MRRRWERSRENGRHNARRLFPLAAVRPEDLSVVDEASGAGVARGTVRLVEYQGREYDVEIALDAGAVLKARLPSAPKVGSIVDLSVDPTRVGPPRSRSASALRMSAGNDTNTGPVGGAKAVLAARWMTRGNS